MGDRTLEGIIPERFASWRIAPGVGAVLPPSEGSLADLLYDEILARGYFQEPVRDISPVMMLATRGSVQSDALQLHRPEACYPAVGFTIIGRRLETLTLGPGMSAPAVFLTAQFDERIEDIIYWTRIGQDFPQTAAEQRSDRLKLALRGAVGDGILMRFSAVRRASEPELFPMIAGCVAAMAQGTRPGDRPALFKMATA
jgi:EpsI family protein